jgi:hypothetical protein
VTARSNLISVASVLFPHRTYALKRGMTGASGTASTGGTDSLLLPLWGQICCRLMAEPECATQLRTAGFINLQVSIIQQLCLCDSVVCHILLQRLVGGLRDWKRVWCVMRQNHLRCWSCPEDVGKKMPMDTIDLTPVSGRCVNN